MLINYMEIVVCNLLPILLQKYTDICKCEKCLEDIKAIALNKLPPRYVSTEQGMIYTKVQLLKIQNEIDVIKCITEAIKIVSKNPNHDIKANL